MSILGIYDELEEIWNPTSTGRIGGRILIPIGKDLKDTKSIVKFLRIILKDIRTIKEIFKIENLEFIIDMELKNNLLSFNAEVKKTFKEKNFIEAVLKKIKSVKFIYGEDKIRVLKETIIF